MYKVKVNNQFDYEINKKGEELFVNGDLLQADFSEISKNNSHVIYQNKSFNTELIDINYAEKTCTVKVNSNIYQIQLEDGFDQLLKELGMDNLSSNKVLEIKAPMPGLVLNILIAENDEIKKGDNLLVLEAMKMENIIKSSTEAVVKKILIKQGDKVEKNQILIQFK